VYEVTEPFETPSTTTSATRYPAFGVTVNCPLEPLVMVTLPEGEMEPFAPALAVIVF
jgi:hypothetical protein